jgi:hypothetical protein
MPSNDAWLAARIERTRTLIEAHEDAIEALSSGAQTYHLDTGQTRQTVTKAQLSQLMNALTRLENRLSVLEIRRHGGATYQAKPGF